MTTLHETDIDGVRCFWVDTGRPTLAAMLLFRYGMADEPILESGWQHLVEHMALEGRDRGGLQVNGHVSLLDTGLQAHGRHDDVVDFLDRVTGWLAAPELDEFANDVRVLRAESQARGTSPTASALAMRYGARGPGLSAYGEVGLGEVSPAALADRARRVCTQGNAVLILDGAPPRGLRLHLPPGDLIPRRPAVPCDDKLPAAYVSNVGLVLSGVVPRSVTMAVGHDMLRRRLSERLRQEQGSAYAPWATYEPVDGEHAVVIGGSDLHRDGLRSAGDTTLMIARGLAGSPPADEEVEALRAAYVQSLRDPYQQIGVAVRAAHDHLEGRPVRSFDEIVAEVEDITAAQLREGWRSFNETLLLGLPGEASWGRQLPMLSFPATVPRDQGDRFRSTDWPADRARLTVGSTGIEVVADGRAQRVPVDQVAALLTYDDARRYLLRNDGYGLLVRADEWRRGHAAIARIDDVVPRGLHLRQPGETAPAARRMSTGRRWWVGLTRLLHPKRPRMDLYSALILLVLFAGLGMAVAVVAEGAPAQLVTVILLTSILVRLVLWLQNDSMRR